MVSEFIELRSSAGNNRVNHGIGVFWGFLVGVGRTRCAPTGFWGFLGFFGGDWAHAMRPYGFWGGFFGGFLMGVGRTRCAPTGFGGVFWGFFDGGWAHAMRPYGFWGDFLGVSGKIRRCELRSLMMGIDKRFCAYWGNI